MAPSIEDSLCVSLRVQCSDGLEKGVLHGLCGRDSPILVVHQHLVQEVDSVLCHARIVVLVDETLKRNLFGVANQLDKLFWHVDAVTAHVLKEVCRAHHIYDLDELIVVV